MGSCISKCRSKKKSEEDCNCVQDKLVISQSKVSPIPPPTKKSLPPLSPPSSTSSFSCTTSSSYSLTSSSSSSSSCSSSILSSRDRSFSNEFLWSCAKDNPHIMLIDPAKSVPTKVHVTKLGSLAKPIVPPVKQSIQQRPVRTTPQKRARASSPTLTRQKSFRKEPEKPNSPHSISSRTLRSPSPSRRFSTGENYKGVLSNTPKESFGKRSIGTSKVSKVNSESSCVRKENVRPASPNNNTSRHCSHLRNREKCIYQIGSKVDGIAVEEVVSNADHVDKSVPMEDIANPLIALDCFIFL